jgi:plastocyanin
LQDHLVTIEGMKFVPERLEVAAGDTVTWSNKDLVPHTVTAPAAGIESGTIASGATWQTVMRSRGETNYVCRFHPTMKAVVVVK